MGFKVEIDSVDQTDRVLSASFSNRMNERSTARIVCDDVLAVPDQEVPILIYGKDGVTLIYGGILSNRAVKGDEEDSDEHVTELYCDDFLIFAEWCDISLTYAAQVALEDVVDDIVTGALAAYGFTYTPAATGVTLEPFSVTDKVAGELLRELMKASQRILRSSPTKVLTVSAPGATAAPASITDATAPTYVLALSRRDNPRVRANRIVLICGPSTGAFLYVGFRTANGTDTSWQFDTRGQYSPWNIIVGGVYRNVTPVGGGGEFEWDEATFTLFVGTAGTPTNGTVIEVSYHVSYPFRVSAASGATPVRTYREARPSITDVPSSLVAAQALLAQLDRTDAIEIDLLTDQDGFGVNQLLSVNTTLRGGIVDDFLIQEVDVTIGHDDEDWRYLLRAIGGGEYLGSFQDEMRQLVGGGSGGIAVAGGGAITLVTITGPIYLGGSTTSWRSPSPAAWIPVPNQVPYAAQATFTGRVRVQIKARTAGISVTARLWDVTANAAAGTSTAVTATSATERTFIVAIASGHTYRAEILNSADGEPVGCESAVLEAV